MVPGPMFPPRPKLIWKCKRCGTTKNHEFKKCPTCGKRQ